jgi:uncharacterized coiled-coil protein SlyX
VSEVTITKRRLRELEATSALAGDMLRALSKMERVEDLCATLVEIQAAMACYTARIAVVEAMS